MNWQPDTKKWPDRRAILFVHGIGNSKPGDYDSLIQEFLKGIGQDVADKLAVYFLYYDDINDQHANKSQLADGISKIKGFIKARASQESGDELSEAIAEYSSDVIFPVLSEAARINIRERFIAQLQQIRLDGKASGVFFFEQEITIICHSMGCFHTYEALHGAASNEQYHLLPVTDNMQFANVIFMASPVQLIRSIASRLGDVVPKSGLATLSGAKFFVPSQKTATGRTVYSTNNWISITGDLDPVGGYFFKKRADWAYMNVEGQKSFIDNQSALDINSKEELAEIIMEAVGKQGVPSLPINNPHSWDAYIQRHKEDLITWLNA
ncbi:hypothetical protein IID10_15730 [candidate division KSB1 bacterium]|nr:hypothetical protein [candidate division KSB1 bacterium]